jgi:tetratricopeptide (TPR) repeat protein
MRSIGKANSMARSDCTRSSPRLRGKTMKYSTWRQPSAASAILDYYRLSLEISKEAQDFHTAAVTMTSMGNVLRDKGEFDEAKSLYETAIQIGEESKDDNGLGFRLLNLGALHFLKKDHAQARSCYERSLGHFKKIPSMTGIALVEKHLLMLDTE